MKSANRYIQPGERVHNPLRPEWGAGQVQSVSETSLPSILKMLANL